MANGKGQAQSKCFNTIYDIIYNVLNSRFACNPLQSLDISADPKVDFVGAQRLLRRVAVHPLAPLPPSHSQLGTFGKIKSFEPSELNFDQILNLDWIWTATGVLRGLCTALMRWAAPGWHYSGIAVTKNFVASPSGSRVFARGGGVVCETGHSSRILRSSLPQHV